MAEVQIQKMNINHELILNWLILNPEKTQGECAEYFGVTQAWLSVIVNSDCFQARWAEKKMFMDKGIVSLTQAQLSAVASKGLERLEKMVESSVDPEFVLNTTNKALERLGYGPKNTPSSVSVTQQINNYTVDKDLLARARGQILDANVAQAIADKESELPTVKVELLEPEKKA